MTVNLQTLVEATRDFVHAEVLATDDEFDGDIAAAGGDTLREKLQAKARAAGIFAPYAPA